MTRFVPFVLCLLLVTSGCATTGRSEAPRAAAAAQTSARSPLVVVLVVDQMRSEYFDAYGARFTGGLRRLMDEGAWFRNAAYPYLNTVTCAGHSTIGTGAFPYRHGMVLNAWWDRESGKEVGRMGSMGESGGMFWGLHMIAVDSRGNIYTGEVFAGQRIQRFVPADSPRGKLLEQLSKMGL